MNIFTPKNPLVKYSRFASRLDPVRDWIILLMVGMVALVGIVVWNMLAFTTVVNGGVIGKVATSTLPVFNQASLDVVHAVFSSRAAEEEKYVTGAYRYTDPSL